VCVFEREGERERETPVRGVFFSPDQRVNQSERGAGSALAAAPPRPFLSHLVLISSLGVASFPLF